VAAEEDVGHATVTGGSPLLPANRPHNVCTDRHIAAFSLRWAPLAPAYVSRIALLSFHPQAALSLVRAWFNQACQQHAARTQPRCGALGVPAATARRSPRGQPIWCANEPLFETNAVTLA
jgi:hypothetical protein